MTATASSVATLPGGDPAAQGSRVLPRPSPQEGELPSRAHRQLPLEKGTAAGRGPRPSCSRCQPSHTQRRAPATPKGNNCPVHQRQGEGCHLWGHWHSPQGARAGVQSSSKSAQAAKSSPRLQAEHGTAAPCQESCLLSSVSPGNGSLGQVASCPTASVSPAGRDGGAWAGGGLPWRDPSPRVVAPCDIQRELAVTQSSGDLHGKGPPVWGQDFVWGQTGPDSSTGHLARWHDPPQLPTPGGQRTTPKRTSPVTLMAHGAAWGQPAPHARTRSAGVSTLFPLCC